MAAMKKAERGGVRERGMGVWRAAVRAAFPTRERGGRRRLETLTAKRAVGKNQRRRRGPGARTVKIHTFSESIKRLRGYKIGDFIKNALRGNKERS